MLYPVPASTPQPYCLSPQEWNNPAGVLNDFFKCYPLPRALNLLHQWMQSAFCGKSRLNKRDVFIMLDLREQLIRLLEAAQLLNDNPDNGEKRLHRNSADEALPLHTETYCLPGSSLGAWDCFPRHLDKAEFADPYIAIEKCLGHLHLDGWADFLMHLFNAAVCDGNIYDMVTDDDLYTTILYLFKLQEACHLIMVREVK